jgi:DNA-binding PadR family transcriptional regulator
VALAEAILVCLAEQPLSGYDLTKTFQTSIGFFWRADHQQIYRELRRLRESGWVHGEAVVQSGKPDKRVYTITEAGRARLVEWSRESHPAPPVKDDLLVTLYGLADVDVGAVAAQITQRLTAHRERLELYERIERTVYADVDGADATAVGRALGLQLGLDYERAWIHWCRHALARLDAFAPARDDNLP